MQQRGAPLALLLPRGRCLSSPAVTRAHLSASPLGRGHFQDRLASTSYAKRGIGDPEILRDLN